MRGTSVSLLGEHMGTCGIHVGGRGTVMWGEAKCGVRFSECGYQTFGAESREGRGEEGRAWSKTRRLSKQGSLGSEQEAT